MAVGSLRIIDDRFSSKYNIFPEQGCEIHIDIQTYINQVLLAQKYRFVLHICHNIYLHNIITNITKYFFFVKTRKKERKSKHVVL